MHVNYYKNNDNITLPLILVAAFPLQGVQLAAVTLSLATVVSCAVPGSHQLGQDFLQACQAAP